MNGSSRSKFTSTLKLITWYTTATICHHFLGHKGYAALNFTLAFTLRIGIALHYRLVNAHVSLRNGRVNQCSQRHIHAMYMYDAMKYLGGQQGHVYIIWTLLKREASLGCIDRITLYANLVHSEAIVCNVTFKYIHRGP